MEPRFRVTSVALVAWAVAALVGAPLIVYAQCPPGALFHPSVSIGVNIDGQAVAADVNADGTLDLVDAPGVAVADFNGDGILDIAATGPAQVHIGMRVAGRGVGSFYPAASYVGGTTGFATGTSDSIGVLLGRGDGSFGAVVRYPTSLIQTRMVTGDFDSNGITDLAIGNISAPGDSVAFSVMLGRGTAGIGDGTFNPPSHYSGIVYNTGQYIATLDLAVGDFNRDGISDIACLSGQSGDRIWVFGGQGTNGHGDGTFGPLVNLYAGFDSGYHLKVSDFDNDGVQDLAIGFRQGVSILRGLGADAIGLSTFAQPFFFALDSQWPSVLDLIVADVNHDGIMDLALSGIGRADYLYGPLNTFVAILLGNGIDGTGNGSFARAQYYPDIRGQSSPIVQGDFNEDGAIDLITGPSGAMFAGRCLDLEASAPFLADVHDVPNDQGGRVSVTWTRSGFDIPSVRIITDYTIWRRISPSAAKGSGLPQESDPQRAIEAGRHAVRVLPSTDGSEVTYWEALQTVPAHFLEGYGFTAATTQDSMPLNNPYTAFFVSALAQDPFVFFESNVDSGYSVDNLAPGQVQGVSSFLIEPGRLRISWRRNQDPDISHYVVYKGLDPAFTPEPGYAIAASADTSYTDANFNGAGVYYKVSAVDIHGNHSRFPALVDVAASLFSRTELFTPYESPDGKIVFRYRLSRPSEGARLEVFDVAGRRVWTTASGAQQGEHRVVWDRATGASGLGRGVYLARLAAGSDRMTRKFVATVR